LRELRDPGELNIKVVERRTDADVRVRPHILFWPAGSVTGPKWSQNTKGPTERCTAAGSNRRTSKSPMSRMAGLIRVIGSNSMRLV